MMRPFVFTFALPALLTLLSFCTTGAGYVRPAQVFELGVAEAEVVACGSVEFVQKTGGTEIVGARVKIDSRIKGNCRDRIRVAVHSSKNIVGDRFLFCLRVMQGRPEDGADPWFVESGYPIVPLFEPSEDQMRQWVDWNTTITTIDGLRPWSDAQRLAEEVCADPCVRAGQIREVSVGGFVYPTISKTEQHFIPLANSENPQERVAAISVLREFNTPQSVAVLQRLVHDLSNRDFGSGASHERYYPVRAAAREALSHLGAPVPAERVEDTLVEYRPLSVHGRLAGTVVLILIGVLCVIWWLSSRRYRVSIMLGVAWTIVMLAAVLFWTRSFKTGDEWVFSGSSRMRVATSDGLLQFAVISHWPDRREARWGSFPMKRDLPADSEERFPWWTEQEVLPPPRPAVLWTRLDSRWPPLGADYLEQQRTISRSTQKYGVSIASGQAGDSMGGMQPFFMVRLPIAYVLALMTLVPVE